MENSPVVRGPLREETRQPQARAPALPALTGARFFAAGSVVAFHYGHDPMAAIVPLFGSLAAMGPAAVSFFYVLSGAVLTWGATGADGRSARPARVFWIQRAARILPAYFTALVISLPTFAAAVLKIHAGGGGYARIVAGIVACTLVVQAFLPPLSAGLNTPGWSISCEGFFYAVWPRLVGRLRRAEPGFPWRAVMLLYGIGLLAPLLCIAAIQGGALPAAPYGPYPTLLDDVSATELAVRLVSYFPLLRLPEFVLGIVVGHALRRTPARARSAGVDTLREAVLVAALVAVGSVLGAEPWGGPAVGVNALSRRVLIESGTLAPLLALFVWQLARGRGWLQRALSIPWLLALGEASYALYILQEPVFVWLTAILKRTAPSLVTPAAWNKTYWAYAALLVVASLATHAFVEQPLRKLLTARWARVSPRAAAS
ncbi:MAG TPA: acyltransferase [Polyangiaceae bacterium]|nr:acyltransferase [Polyangiaceae bacterium]